MLRWKGDSATVLILGQPHIPAHGAGPSLEGAALQQPAAAAGAAGGNDAAIRAPAGENPDGQVVVLEDAIADGKPEGDQEQSEQPDGDTGSYGFRIG